MKESTTDASRTGNGSVELSELRELLLEPERSQITDARERIEQIENRTVDITVDQVSQLLPDAVAHRSKKDQRLANALAPTVEQTIQVSVRRDPKPIVDAIFPVIGPAIRKAISEALSSTLESINQTMEHRFSMKAIRWRLEARRSGRSFSEVAMSHTLLYRIEQLFMIDRETGVPLVHVATPEAHAKDGSVVSSMLTAIQDFVQDSFGSDDDELLETLEVGDVNVWFETGPHATVAAVIRGIPPKSLRDHLKELVENFHMVYSEELIGFDGDVDPFQGSVPMLTAGLLEQKQESKSGSSWLLWFLLFIGITAAGWFLYQAIDARLQRSNFLAELDAKPGVVVTDSFTRNGFLNVIGLKDPLSEDVTSLAVSNGLDPDKINYDWEPYHTLSPGIVTQRAVAVLSPPETVRLGVEDGTVYARGEATTRWINEARDRSRFLSGSLGYDDAAVVRVEDIVIAEAREEIESLWIGFAYESAEIPVTEFERVDRLVGQIARLAEAADLRDVSFEITLWGGASGDAEAGINQFLMEARSSAVETALTSRGVAEEWLVRRSKAELGSADTQEAERARSVDLEVEIIP